MLLVLMSKFLSTFSHLRKIFSREASTIVSLFLTVYSASHQVVVRGNTVELHQKRKVGCKSMTTTQETSRALRGREVEDDIWIK
jgi:hypothetical protein